jgi:hypothetical protein
MTWSIANSGLPPSSPVGIVVINGVTRKVYVTVRDGIIYESTDYGNYWKKLKGIDGVLAMAFSPDYRGLYVGKPTGIYRKSKMF